MCRSLFSPYQCLMSRIDEPVSSELMGRTLAGELAGIHQHTVLHRAKLHFPALHAIKWTTSLSLAGRGCVKDRCLLYSRLEPYCTSSTSSFFSFHKLSWDRKSLVSWVTERNRDLAFKTVSGVSNLNLLALSGAGLIQPMKQGSGHRTSMFFRLHNII